MSRHPNIHVGATWRRRKTGALLKITAVNWSGLNHDYADVQWETVRKPKRKGVSYEDYWVKNCEPVDEP